MTAASTKTRHAGATSDEKCHGKRDWLCATLTKAKLRGFSKVAVDSCRLAEDAQADSASAMSHKAATRIETR